MVEMELRRLADYLVDDEDHFAELLARKTNKQMEGEKKSVQAELTKAEARLELLPKLLKTLYEDRVSERRRTRTTPFCPESTPRSGKR